MSLYTATILLLLLWIAKINFLFAKLLRPFQLSADEEKATQSIKYLMIVPVHNEETIIEGKLKNIRELKLSRTNVCLVDSSSDSTGLIIKKFINDNKDLKISYVFDERKARNVKLNIAMAQNPGDRVIVSDADSIIRSNIEMILDNYFSDERVAFVSAKVKQLNALKADNLFWEKQDMLRALESKLGHCSVASGAFYAFRGELVKEIADYVWADDIYVPFILNNKGYKSVIAEEISVEEIRTPSSIKELYDVKVRKAKDNIVLSMKNCFKLNIIKTPVWSIIFYTRFLQLLSPVLLLFLVLSVTKNILITTLTFIAVAALWAFVRSSENSLEAVSKNTYLFTLMVLAHALLGCFSKRGFDACK